MSRKKPNLSASLVDGSEPCFEFCCEVCNDDGKHKEAEDFCFHCGEYLCLDCVESHKRTRLTRHHRLTGKDGLPRTKPQKVSSQNMTKDKCTTPCPHHRRKFIEYYCANHDQLGCSACMVINHRNCEFVEFLPDISEGLIDSQVYKQFIQQIQEVEQTAYNTLQKANSNNVKNDLWFSDIQLQIKQVRMEINSRLDNIETQLMSKAEKLNFENSETLKSVSATCKDTSNALDKIKADMAKLQQSNQHCKMFVAMKEAQKQMKALQADTSDAEKDTNITVYEFKANATLIELTQHNDVLGKICTHRLQDRTSRETTGFSVQGDKPQSRPRKSIAIHKELINPNHPHEHSQNITVQHRMDINVVTGKEKTCEIRSIVMLPDKRLLLADSQNQKVLIIHSNQRKVVSELRLKSFPWEATHFRNQVAVTVPWEKKILLMSMDHELKLEREITVDGLCRGIAAIGDNLVVSYQSPSKIEILDEMGSLVMPIIGNDKGQELLHSPHHLAVDRDRATIYMSDFETNTVTSMSLDGEVKAMYRNEDLSGADDVCVDQNGFVYVCGRASNNIHMLTPDCKKVKILLSKRDGLKMPASVCYCDGANQLFVGMLDGRAIKVYQCT